MQTLADLPAMYWTTWRVQHAGLDYTLPAHQIRGRRLTVTYRASDRAPELRLDGTLLATGSRTTVGYTYALTTTNSSIRGC